MRKLIALTATLAATLSPLLIIAARATGATRTERFSFADTSTSNGPPIFSVIATGEFVAGGTATGAGTGVVTLHFPTGTIMFDSAHKHEQITKSQTATACIQTETGHGAYTIAGGTGTYRGITGSGRMRISATFVEDAAHGHCSNSFAAAQSLRTAVGPVALP